MCEYVSSFRSKRVDSHVSNDHSLFVCLCIIVRTPLTQPARNRQQKISICIAEMQFRFFELLLDRCFFFHLLCLSLPSRAPARAFVCECIWQWPFAVCRTRAGARARAQAHFHDSFCDSLVLWSNAGLFVACNYVSNGLQKETQHRKMIYLPAE